MPTVGGVARRATFITKERQKTDALLALDAGNSLIGDQDPARETQGKSSVEALNRLGYDAMALGQADLDLGLTALRQRIGEAKFAMLSANAFNKATGQRVAEPYLLKEFAGHRVAVIGLSGGVGGPEIEVRDPVQAMQEVVADLAGRADEILVLSAAGPDADQRVAENVPGVVAIIGGGAGPLSDPWHSPRTGVVWLRADSPAPGHAGRNLGVARLGFSSDGKLASEQWQRVALGPEVASDIAMAAWVQEQTGQ